MANRLLTCCFVVLGLAWLAVWLEFNRAPHSLAPQAQLMRGDREGVCYGWPYLMMFDDALIEEFYFEHKRPRLTWWEYDCLALNVVTLGVGGLLLGLMWQTMRSLLLQRTLSLRLALVGLTAIAGLLALAGNEARRFQQATTFRAEALATHGSLLTVNTLPDWLVAQLPQAARDYQASIVGLAELNSHAWSTSAKIPAVPSHVRLRYLEFLNYEQRASFPEQELALEPDSLRVLGVWWITDVGAFSPLFKNQANLRVLGFYQSTIQLDAIPVDTLRRLEGLHIEESLLQGDFAAPAALGNLRQLRASIYDDSMYDNPQFVLCSKNFAPLIQSLPTMPQLSHLSLEVRATSDQLDRWLAACPALVELEVDVDQQNVGEMFRWAEVWGLECFTKLYRAAAQPPSFSEARLRTALQQGKPVVWVIGSDYQNTAVLSNLVVEQIQAAQSAGVCYFNSQAGDRQEFPAERWAHRTGGDGVVVILLFGEHPALDRVAATWGEKCLVKRMTAAETAQLLAPP